MLVLALVSCGGEMSTRGELVGVKSNTNWLAERPYGMVLIPGGAFTMGKAEENRWGGAELAPRTVTVKDFFMDETEITNSEYKQFVHYVRDSIVRTKLAEMAELQGDEVEVSSNRKNKNLSINTFKYKYADIDEDSENITAYQKFLLKTTGSAGGEQRPLNWKPKIIWKTKDYPDEAYAEAMEELYLQPEGSYGGASRVFDISKLVYTYGVEAEEVYGRKAAKKSEIVPLDINIYPDTAVWIKDFEYSSNDAMTDNYFWHQAYEGYPVVGVSWKQANAFCNWRTKHKNDFLSKSGSSVKIARFRLPSESEWEYAARGGVENGMYPWGGPYIRDKQGFFLANFKPLRNEFSADGFTFTVEAQSFQSNGYGLYNMAGNVAEWTKTAFNNSAKYMSTSLNIDVRDPTNQRKVTRGGSWKDVAYFLEVSSRDFEYADSSKSYIGFRTVQDYLGDLFTNDINY